MNNKGITGIVKDIWNDDYDTEDKLMALDDMTDSKSCIAKVTKADLVEAIKWMLETCIS